MEQIKETIKIAPNVEVIFRSDDDCINELKNNLSDSVKYLEDFYKIKVPEVTIELIYSREEFEDKAHYEKSPEWLVAMANKNKIFLISPLVIEKISCHKKSKIKKIIIHELCHIFNEKINKDILMWIDEGIALFIAGQRKKQDFTKEEYNFFINNLLYKKTNLGFFSKNNGYKISYYLIDKIVTKLGKDALLDLIRANSKSKIERIMIQIKKEDIPLS